MTGRWCHACTIPHRMDCRTCFGFGVSVATVDGRRMLVPVSADAAHGCGKPGGTVYACPECDGGRTNVHTARALGALPSDWAAPAGQL